MDTNLLTITYDVILSFNLLHSLLGMFCGLQILVLANFNVSLTILSFDILNRGTHENGQEIAVKRIST
uniref:Uncharacterized protein n=1 Tax=Helianthus annuus TaxID=4232 RepID=A0A251SVF4_HELAN